jgi:type 1 glutamine amidotransferase
VLQNNSSKRKKNRQARNLFLDELEDNAKYDSLTKSERHAKAESLERSILDFVVGGKGLVAIHGVTMLPNSAAFDGMLGGTFEYHPPNQEVTVRTVEDDHPLVAAFRGKGPLVHRDEPYCFGGAYHELDFRPLLSMDVEGLKDPRGRVGETVRYVSWVKPHGKGRVLYCSPGHFPESYQSATLLQFLLDGIQYAAGDLKCDDSTPVSQAPTAKHPH